MLRREFTRIAGLATLATYTFPKMASTEVIRNSQLNSARVPMGLCNHSLRSLRLSAQQLIEYAIDKKLDSILLNTFQPFESREKSHLSDLKKNAQSNNVSIYVGVGSISEKSTKFTAKYGDSEKLLLEGIRVASAVGSPVVACRIGAIEDRYIDGGIQVHIEAVVKLMKSMRSRAQDAGIKFAFENHVADLRSSELLELINETGTDICGALFDPANALWAMEDPMQALKTLGENIICTSIRDIEVWETEEGAIFKGMAIGDGILDYPLFAKTMAKNCPGVPLHIETISNSARPIPFLKDEFWKGFPNLEASGLIDFLKLVRKGKPIELDKPPIGMNKKEFDIQHQKNELLSSIKYLRENCNAGLKI